jgi:hypothetical protein
VAQCSDNRFGAKTRRSDDKRVTTPIPDSASRSAKSPNGTTPLLTSLVDRFNQLARRAARLNDQAEVTNLQDSYGYAVDYAVDRKLWDEGGGCFRR